MLHKLICLVFAAFILTGCRGGGGGGGSSSTSGAQNAVILDTDEGTKLVSIDDGSLDGGTDSGSSSGSNHANPEPSSIILLASGLMGMAFYRKSKKIK